MAVKPILTSETWLLRQLANLQHLHPDMVNPVLERILDEDEALRWALIVNAYLDEQINLGKAAELLDMSEIELRKKFMLMGIPVRHGSGNAREARAEVDAIRSWFGEG